MMINLINRFFDKNYPLDSALDYLSTENTTDKLGHSYCDMVIRVANAEEFIIEAQSTNDSNIALRIFDYSYLSGLKHKTVKNHIIEIHLASGKAIFLAPKYKVPAKEIVRVIAPNGKKLEYEVEAISLLDYTIEELEELGMLPLLPFYILKYRKDVKATRSSAKRGELAVKTKALIEDLVAAAERAVNNGIMTTGEMREVIYLLHRLYADTYKPYTEFKEVTKMVDDAIVLEIDLAKQLGEKRGEKKKAIEFAQYLIGKRWKAEEIMEATKLDLDTVKSLFTTSNVAGRK